MFLKPSATLFLLKNVFPTGPYYSPRVGKKKFSGPTHIDKHELMLYNHQRFPDFSSFLWLCSKFGSEIPSFVLNFVRNFVLNFFWILVRISFWISFRIPFWILFRISDRQRAFFKRFTSPLLKDQMSRSLENKSCTVIWVYSENVFEPYPNAKNHPKTRSTYKDKIEGSVENESCSAIQINQKRFWMLPQP